MTHILIPREPSTALLRPFIGCNTQELHEAWAAMVRIAEVQHARAGQPIDFEEDDVAPKLEAPAAPGTTDAAIDAIVLRQTGFDGDGYQAMTADELRRIVRSALGELAAAPQAPAAHVDDLAALVKKLVQALRKAAPNHVLPAQALDYLKRQGLQGSPLRAAEAAPQAPAAPSVYSDDMLAALHQWRQRCEVMGAPHLLPDSHLLDLEEAGLLRKVRGGHVMTTAGRAALAAPAAPRVVLVDWEMEDRDPVEMLDKIYAVYQRSMGKPAPDAEMAEVVELTKDMLLAWWGEHREDVRAAMVAAQQEAAPAAPAVDAPARPELTVAYHAMPESNGKRNWTVLLRRKDASGLGMGDISHGICFYRGEYHGRGAYYADRLRFLIGELTQEPFILDYDSESMEPAAAQAKEGGEA